MMNFRNIAISLVFAAALAAIHLGRSALGGLYPAIFYLAILIGGALLGRELLSKEVKYDERTAQVTGSAAKITLIATFALALAALVFLSVTDRPTSPQAVLTLLLGAMGVVYALAYAYRDKYA